MKFTFLLIFSLSVLLVAQAQNGKNLLVLQVKGSGYYTRDKYKIPLKLGTSLSANDQVTLSRKTEVIIVCNNYGLITIPNSTNGQFSFAIKNYIGQCNALRNNVSANFISYLAKHLKEEHLNVDDNKTEHLHETGAVVRGCPDEAFNKIPDTLSVYKIPANIKYLRSDTTARVELVLYHDENAVLPIYKSTISRNSIFFDSSVLQLLQPNQYYYWTVSRNGLGSCGKKIVNRVSDDRYEKVMTDIKKNGFERLSPDEQNKAIVFMLKQANLIAEAYRYARLVKKGDPISNVIKQDLEEQLLFR